MRATNDKRPRLHHLPGLADDEDGVFWGGCSAAALPRLAGSLARLANPVLQGLQLLGVFMAGLVVADDGGSNGRECKSFGGRISISGGLGQFTGGGSVILKDVPPYSKFQLTQIMPVEVDEIADPFGCLVCDDSSTNSK